MVACLGGMVVNVGDSSFELLSNALSLDSKYELSSLLVDTIDVTKVVGVSMDTSSHESFEVYKQSLHSRDDHDDIPLCVGFMMREQWMCFDVIIHNELGVIVTNDIYRNFDPCECVDANFLGVIVTDDIYKNSDPCECVDANPLGVDDIGVYILNSLLLFEVPLTIFSLNRWPLRQVLYEKIRLWDHG
jgi:hypothetical protein